MIIFSLYKAVPEHKGRVSTWGHSAVLSRSIVVYKLGFLFLLGDEILLSKHFSH